MWQLRLSDLHDEETHFASLVIGNLDDDGYLKLEDVPAVEVVPKLAAEANLDPEDAEEVLKIIQRFDPIGAALPKECGTRPSPPRSRSRCSPR